MCKRDEEKEMSIKERNKKIHNANKMRKRSIAYQRLSPSKSGKGAIAPMEIRGKSDNPQGDEGLCMMGQFKHDDRTGHRKKERKKERKGNGERGK